MREQGVRGLAVHCLIGNGHAAECGIVRLDGGRGALAEGQMRVSALALLLGLCLSLGTAKAQSDQEMIWALGEVGEELQTCSVYFTIISGCTAQQRPDLSKIYQQAAEKLALLGASSKQSAGVSPEAYLAFSDVLFKDIKKSIGGSCTNIAVLLNKYKIRLTLESAEVDTRANGAIQVVGEPSDTAPDGTIEIHLVHPVECRVRKMSKVPPQESSAEKAVGAKCAVGSVVGQRHEAPHVAKMEFGKRTPSALYCVLSRTIGRGQSRPPQRDGSRADPEQDQNPNRRLRSQ
jgi:hypothetical protein